MLSIGVAASSFPAAAAFLYQAAPPGRGGSRRLAVHRHRGKHFMSETSFPLVYGLSIAGLAGVFSEIQMKLILIT